MILTNIVKKSIKKCRRFAAWIRVVFVLVHCIVRVQADLIHGPPDTEVIRGTNISLPCTTSFASSHYVNWFYVPFGTTERKELYYDDTNIIPYYPRFEISKDGGKGEYNMTVSSVDFQDCGLYICIDKNGFGEQRRAELVVLNSAPTVLSNISIDGLSICKVGVHYISLTCSLSYKGNIAPTLCWEEVTPGGKVNRYACNANDTTHFYNESTAVVTTTKTVVVDYTYDRMSFYCYTRASGIRSSPTTIRVKYILSNADSIRNGSSKYCSVEANVECEFGLLDTNDETAKSVSQNLTFDSERKYTKLCKYICTIGDQVCKGYQPIYEEDLASCDSCKSKTIGLSVALVTLILTVVIAMAVVKFKYVITRKKKNISGISLMQTAKVDREDN